MGKLRSPDRSGFEGNFEHSPQPELRALLDTTAKSISSAQVSDPDPVGLGSSTNWIHAAITIAKALPPPAETSLPGSPRFKLISLQILARAEVADDIKSSVKIRSAQEISAALTADIAAGHALIQPEKFAALVSEVMKTKIDWPGVIQAAATRLRTDNVVQLEAKCLIDLMISALTIGHDNTAFQSLKDLSTQGILSHIQNLYNAEKDVRAAVTIGTLLANPTYERAQHHGQSP